MFESSASMVDLGHEIGAAATSGPKAVGRGDQLGRGPGSFGVRLIRRGVRR